MSRRWPLALFLLASAPAFARTEQPPSRPPDSACIPERVIKRGPDFRNPGTGGRLAREPVFPGAHMAVPNAPVMTPIPAPAYVDGNRGTRLTHGRSFADMAVAWAHPVTAFNTTEYHVCVAHAGTPGALAACGGNSIADTGRLGVATFVVPCGQNALTLNHQAKWPAQGAFNAIGQAEGKFIPLEVRVRACNRWNKARGCSPWSAPTGFTLVPSPEFNIDAEGSAVTVNDTGVAFKWFWIASGIPNDNTISARLCLTEAGRVCPAEGEDPGRGDPRRWPFVQNVSAQNAGIAGSPRDAARVRIAWSPGNIPYSFRGKEILWTVAVCLRYDPPGGPPDQRPCVFSQFYGRVRYP